MSARPAERRALRRVLATAPPDGRLAAATLACGAAAVLAAIALLACSGALISKAALRPPVLSLSVLIVTVRALGLVRATARYGERLASHDLALRALGRLRSTFYARLAPLVPAGLRTGHGDLLSRFVQDVEQLQDLYVRALGPPAIAVVTGAITVAAAAVMLPAAGVVVLAGLLAAGVGVPLLTAAAAARAGRRQAAARARLASEVLEAARYGEELAVLGQSAARVARLEAADRHLRALARRDAAAGALATASGALVQAAAVVGTLVVAIPAVDGGQLDGILLAALVLLTLASFEATAPLPGAAQQLGACASASARLVDVLDAPVVVRAPDAPVAVPADGVLAVRDVALRFAGEAGRVLDGASLDVRPGEAVAIVGPSGAGKSTLAQLLVRFRDPDAGAVSVGGVDVRALDPLALRRAVRLVAQDDALFTTSVAENVRLARPEASDGEVRAALDAAGLGPWIDELPDGMATLVGEDGAAVSGGQRRRIAVARALLADARFLVLDEPTAHLDPASASALLRTVTAHARDRRAGLVAIVHGAGDLGVFDRVLELRAGRLEPVT